jgi:hypothetical protein
MTTDQMKALPTGQRVKSIETGEVFEKIVDSEPNSYRCDFRKIGSKGLSKNVTRFHGKRIELLSAESVS